MTTGMTYQLLHSPLTARNSCIVSFQWLFTVLKDKKWCSTHSKFIAFTSSGLTGSIVVRQPSRRRCPEEWLHLNLCYSRDLRSVPRHWYDQYDKGGARRGGKVLLPDDGVRTSLSVFSANANRSAAPMIKRGYKLVDWQHYSLTMVATTIMMEERQLFRFPGQRTSSYFQGLVRLHSAETTPRYNSTYDTACKVRKRKSVRGIAWWNGRRRKRIHGGTLQCSRTQMAIYKPCYPPLSVDNDSISTSLHDRTLIPYSIHSNYPACHQYNIIS